MLSFSSITYIISYCLKKNLAFQNTCDILQISCKSRKQSGPLERLNEVLVKADFSKVRPNPLYKNGSHWELLVSIALRFDEDGKFIKPENGDY